MLHHSMGSKRAVTVYMDLNIGNGLFLLIFSFKVNQLQTIHKHSRLVYK